MAEADYRLMTEATGQRIAAALEALHLATVTGVKGNAEGAYRHGDVNITPANIGALPISGGTLTGALALTNYFSINDKSGDRYGVIRFNDTVQNIDGACEIIGYTGPHDFEFREKNSSGRAYEAY